MPSRPDPTLDDQRRRYYRLTGLGHRVLTAETRRLADLVALANARGALQRCSDSAIQRFTPFDYGLKSAGLRSGQDSPIRQSANPPIRQSAESLNR